MRPSTLAIAFGAGRVARRSGAAGDTRSHHPERGSATPARPRSLLGRCLGARDVVVGGGLVARGSRAKATRPMAGGRRLADAVDGGATIDGGDTSRATGGVGKQRSPGAPRSSAPGSPTPSIDPDASAPEHQFREDRDHRHGISGLTAARLLHPEHDIVVYKAGDHVGGHTNTIRVDTEDATWDVDTGFIVLNDRNYPRFEALLDELGVARQPANMSFSVSAEAEDFEYSSHGVRGLLAPPSNLARPRFARMVADYVRFNRAARALLADSEDRRSLRAFLDDERFSPWFVDRLLVPQAAAVWSADPDRCGRSRRASSSSSSTTTGCCRSPAGRAGRRSPAARRATWRR